MKQRLVMAPRFSIARRRSWSMSPWWVWIPGAQLIKDVFRKMSARGVAILMTHTLEVARDVRSHQHHPSGQDHRARNGPGSAGDGGNPDDRSPTSFKTGGRAFRRSTNPLNLMIKPYPYLLLPSVLASRNPCAPIRGERGDLLRARRLAASVWRSRWRFWRILLAHLAACRLAELVITCCVSACPGSS